MTTCRIIDTIPAFQKTWREMQRDTIEKQIEVLRERMSLHEVALLTDCERHLRPLSVQISGKLQ